MRSLLIALLLLSGCAVEPVHRAPDLRGIPFKIVWHDSVASLGRDAAGYTTMRNDVWEVHIRKISPKEDACTLVHELWHIADYTWHIGERNVTRCVPEYAVLQEGE